MTANYPKLSNTPIKETIFSISYSGEIEPQLVERFANQQYISGKYTFGKDGVSGTQRTLHQNETHTLRCHDENKMINIRAGSFSFHKVNEYENFESLLHETMNLWGLLIDSNDRQFSINSISLRYLNFIETETAEINNILNVFPENPFTKTPKTAFVNMSFNDEGNDQVVINVVTAYPVISDNHNHVVLDILLNQPQNNINDYDIIKNDFEIMRGIKNHIFFSSITEHTLAKYL